MDYKIEMHAHTSEVSGCGKIPGSQMAQAYAFGGYKTMVITDHIGADRFTSGRRSVEDRAQLYLAGWREAKKEGDKWGLNVLLGAEVRLISGDEDYLVFGLVEEQIAPLMALLDQKPSIPAFCEKMHEWGMVVVQAHPFRPGHKLAPSDAIDGIEVYNGNARHNSHNDDARAYAEKEGLLMVSGSDAHEMMDLLRGGVISETEIKTNDELVAFLRANKQPRRIETLTGFLKK